jgi:hypothetical protein
VVCGQQRPRVSLLLRKAPFQCIGHEPSLSTRCANRADAVVRPASAETSKHGGLARLRGVELRRAPGPQLRERRKQAIAALIARPKMCTYRGISRQPSGNSQYRGTHKEAVEAALSPNSPCDAALLHRGSLAGPLCNVGSLQKPLWVSHAGGTRDGIWSPCSALWYAPGYRRRTVPPWLSVAGAGACTHGLSGVCWPGSRGSSSVAKGVRNIEGEWYQVVSQWCFASACPTTCSRGRAEKRRRALLASRRRAP